MTYYKARELFEDAARYIDPSNDPVMWDLVNGLHALSWAVENDLRDLQQKVQRLEQR